MKNLNQLKEKEVKRAEALKGGTDGTNDAIVS